MRWSSSFKFSEYPDLQASTFDLDYTGTFLFFPGRKNIILKNLSKDASHIKITPRKVICYNGKALWNPHSINKVICASCNNTNVDILLLQPSRGLDLYRLFSLKSHTRNVSDLDWHPTNPNVLTTTAADYSTHIWDVREPAKPATTFRGGSPSSGVKWNKLSEHTLATCSDGDVKIWDERRSAFPFHYITAHKQDILSMDWNPQNENHIGTSGEDGCIKFFDIANPKNPEFVIKADAPVLKSSYLPFSNWGNCTLSSLIPKAARMEMYLLLWNMTTPAPTVPIHTFVGHTDIVLDYRWKRVAEGCDDYQLVTWSRDDTLRIWQVDDTFRKLANMDFASNDESTMYRNVDYPDSISDDMKDDYPNWIGKIRRKYPSGDICNVVDGDDAGSGFPLEYFNRKTHPTLPKLRRISLQHEFQAALSINGVHLDSMDLTRRICSVTAKVNENVVALLVSFPTSYPRSKTPVFRFLHGTTVGAEARTYILKTLNDICDQHVMRKEACLQSCLEKLVILLNRKMDAEIDTSFAYIEDSSMPIFNANEPSYLVPPKYCSAKFCSVGTLVCFSRQMKPMYNNIECPSSVEPENNSVVKSQFPLRNGMVKNSRQPAKMERRCVLILDTSALMLISRQLCLKYSVTWGNLQLCCEKHAAEASIIRRPDLVNVWTMAAYGVSSLEHLDWDRHPLGKKLLRYIIRKCVESYDVQTAAMIYCMLLQRQREYDIDKSKNKLIRFPGYNSSGYVNLSPYHTISTKESKLEKWIPGLRKARSNSWSDYAEVVRNTGRNEYAQKAEGHSYIIKEHRVSQDEKILYEDVKNAYASILYKWGLLNVRAAVMKCCPSWLEQHRPMDVVVNCCKCRKSIRGNACDFCKTIVMRCSICRLPVRGAAVACIICTHGGHLKHIESWFNTESTCASGCGCLCLLECSALLS